MSIPQYTTPTFLLSFDEQSLDLTQAANVYVTFRSGPYELTKSGEELSVTAKTIGIYLTQLETAQFRTSVEIQANWTTSGGGRYASEIVFYPISGQLLRKVVE